jgi:putative ABC transport system ATP-binding protein
MAILEGHGLRKVYETRGVRTVALDGIDLAVDPGEFAVLHGPSGCGKTTLLNLLGALDTPTEGRVLLGGRDLAGLSPAQLADLRLRALGFVFQAYNLIPVLTARENVEFVMELQRVAPPERRARAEAILTEVGLAALADKRPLEMSGGQQQRVAVARAIVGRPQVVLADEPTANLDSTTAGALLDLMETLNREHGTTFLFSTHDPLVIGKARRRIRLRDGRIQADERAGPS